MEITIYKRKNVKLKFVQYGLAFPFFRLEVPNVSFCYSNPITCVNKALDKLEQREMSRKNNTGFWMGDRELSDLKRATRETIISFLASEASLVDNCDSAVKMDRERLHNKARGLWK